MWIHLFSADMVKNAAAPDRILLYDQQRPITCSGDDCFDVTMCLQVIILLFIFISLSHVLFHFRSASFNKVWILLCLINANNFEMKWQSLKKFVCNIDKWTNTISVESDKFTPCEQNIWTSPLTIFFIPDTLLISFVFLIVVSWMGVLIVCKRILYVLNSFWQRNTKYQISHSMVKLADLP